LAASSSLATAAYAWPSSTAAPETKIPVGVQLWTLRKELAEDLAGTLRQVASIGYQGIELWFQKWPAAVELKKIVADCGLDLASAHVNLKDLLEDFPRLADYHRTVGNRTLVIPFIPNYAGLTQEAWNKTIDDIRHVARTGREAGFEVLYHNHAFELDAINSELAGAEVYDKKVVIDPCYRLRNDSTKSGSSILTTGPSFRRRSNLGSVGSNVSSGLNTRGSTGTYL
jgi:hypothetical protein